MASTAPKEIIEGTQCFWHERTGDALSHEDAREAIANVSAFFNLLAAWDRASGPAGPDVPEPGPEHAARPEVGPAEANAL